MSQSHATSASSEENGQKDALTFFVNGKKVTVPNPDPELSLVLFLRSSLRLTGTKLGCGEGGCGACTVMISRYDRIKDHVIHYAANACLIPICSLHGVAVTTVEGIGSTRTRLHDVQERLASAHGTQCGFCTPGMVMSMYALIRSSKFPSHATMEKALAGNLCRCTGYRPILEGFKTFTKEFVCPMGNQCCQIQQNNTVNGDGDSSGTKADNKEILFETEYKCYDESQEPIFPPELKLISEYCKKSLVFRGKRVTWHRPTNLPQLLELTQLPNAKIIAGNTQIGIETQCNTTLPAHLISIMALNDLNAITWTDAGICIGSAVTMTQLGEALSEAIVKYPEFKTRAFATIVEALNWFAGQQVRNVATIGGHVMTASPLADINPILIAAGAIADVISTDGTKKELTIDESFFLGESRTAVKFNEILLSVNVPFTSEYEFVFGYKQAPRKENSRAIVNAGLKVQFHVASSIVSNATVAFGGVGATTMVAQRAALAMQGRPWSKVSLDAALKELAVDLPSSSCKEYQKALASGFLFKFFIRVHAQLLKTLPIVSLDSLSAADESAALPLQREQPSSIQLFDAVDPKQAASDLVGRATEHRGARSQVAGEAQYADDVTPAADELAIAFVRSTKASANILGVDASEALDMPGVLDYICHKDLPKDKNLYKLFLHTDEYVFAENEVNAYGQTIGVVVADSMVTAQRAAAAVKVTYEERPAIVTIEKAIKKGSFFEPEDGMVLESGNIDEGFKDAAHVLTGTLSIGGQQHFYLEPPAAVVTPKENGEMDVLIPTQGPSGVQIAIAHLLGVPANRVTIRTKRVGGAFGGKDHKLTRNVMPAIVAANKLRRPVRCVLTREEDMSCTGARHPFLVKFKVGAQRDGRVVALLVELFADAGYTREFSPFVMEFALKRIDNCYCVPNMKVIGKLCKTNLPSNTAFRGFGGPQAMMAMEHIMSETAIALGLSQTEIREKNMYQEGDLTPYKQKLVSCQISRCWQECLQQSDAANRKAAIEIFNKENKWKKRGLAVIPTKFPVAGGPAFVHQAGALVHAYLDGSVIIAHGGVELGQGLYTKMIQIATRALNLDSSKIYIQETSTATVPNTTLTGGSVTTDLNGMAVKAACEELVSRLQPFIAVNPKGSWVDWVNAAYLAQVSLSVAGFWGAEGLTETEYHMYFTYGVGCSEVEIDCLTGDHQVLCTDIVMDVGRSLNPAIDIGQIEGAFMQGYGLFCLEEVKFTPNGHPLARGPNTYKVPSFGNIPTKFNVSLLKNAPNPRAVYGSKAIGEPPLFLGASVYFAIKDAVASARSEAGLTGSFPFDTPATPERIRMSLVDEYNGGSC